MAVCMAVYMLEGLYLSRPAITSHQGSVFTHKPMQDRKSELR